MSANYPSIGSGAIVTTCCILDEIRTNAELETILLEYGLSDEVRDQGSIAKTLLALKKFAVANPDFEVATDLGRLPVSHLLVQLAVEKIGWTQRTAALWEKLERYLALDGYSLQKEVTENWGSQDIKVTGLTVAMPSFVELPETASEVDLLLERFGLQVARRHLSSARDNIAQGDFEAANSQCRTFLEALTDAIADGLYPEDAQSRSGGLQKRQLLSEKGFLSRDKHEFGDGNGQTFLPGLAKLLHIDGAHPGISNLPDATFRLQVVVITARWLLKRLEDLAN
ncbi:hypothetical protein [Kordiimonas marina]|uniref:hypothetical protein n=1 Tax=Kordiimonas marina TaxID=2872312 RepID=UPI001FF28BA7|nr:hypothetical protein [Kordiimonas marina]MCJ9428065.1 hypothetical protein [Kordiimonas marina]